MKVNTYYRGFGDLSHTFLNSALQILEILGKCESFILTRDRNILLHEVIIFRWRVESRCSSLLLISIATAVNALKDPLSKRVEWMNASKDIVPAINNEIKAKKANAIKFLRNFLEEIVIINNDTAVSNSKLRKVIKKLESIAKFSKDQFDRAFIDIVLERVIDFNKMMTVGGNVKIELPPKTWDFLINNIKHQISILSEFDEDVELDRFSKINIDDVDPLMGGFKDNIIYVKNRLQSTTTGEYVEYGALLDLIGHFNELEDRAIVKIIKSESNLRDSLKLEYHFNRETVAVLLLAMRRGALRIHGGKIFIDSTSIDSPTLQDAICKMDYKLKFNDFISNIHNIKINNRGI